MSDKLNLKSETAKKPGPKPAMVRLHKDVQFFGINGQQITEGMSGIQLEWNGETAGGVVIVTSPSYPGESKWIFPGAIQFIGWKE